MYQTNKHYQTGLRGHETNLSHTSDYSGWHNPVSCMTYTSEHCRLHVPSQWSQTFKLKWDSDWHGQRWGCRMHWPKASSAQEWWPQVWLQTQSAGCTEGSRKKRVNATHHNIIQYQYFFDVPNYVFIWIYLEPGCRGHREAALCPNVTSSQHERSSLSQHIAAICGLETCNTMTWLASKSRCCTFQQEDGSWRIRLQNLHIQLLKMHSKDFKTTTFSRLGSDWAGLGRAIEELRHFLMGWSSAPWSVCVPVLRNMRQLMPPTIYLDFNVARMLTHSCCVLA